MMKEFLRILVLMLAGAVAQAHPGVGIVAAIAKPAGQR
jgi:hypothetical protein